MNTTFVETIAAIATPVGYGGIAIIRISGPQAREVLLRVFTSPKKEFTLRARYMHYGHAHNKAGQVLDEVLAVYMPAPHSATGEHVAEIHCHGGPGVSLAVLEAAMAAGARPAQPGEFTRRAFMNGRIDLTQAEAVAEMISAPGKEGVRLAAAKLGGVFGQKITGVRAGLDAMRMQVTLAVDFPDEELELMEHERFAGVVHKALADIDALILAYERAKLWREGAKVVLAGCVNAGKSSLFNALLGRYRAIVSPTPGTTRDYIEETINIQGLCVRLMDTAGLRVGEDAVEQEGIALSHELAADADALLLVIDTAKTDVSEEKAFLQQHAQAAARGKVLVVLNKADLTPATTATPASAVGNTCPTFHVSAKAGTGIDALCTGLYSALQQRTATFADAATTDVAPNIRQCAALREAHTALQTLANDLPLHLPPDIISVYLDAALHALDEVTGTTSNEELLDRIFTSFCIGK